MNYSETLDFLFNQIPFFQQNGASDYKPGLQNIEALDVWCGEPHKQYATIHVGGTNGKGSVSNLIASILQEAGYKTGLYTSPHLKDFRERIRINGQLIPEKRVVEFVEKFRIECNQVEPSFFELTTELAFLWFAEEHVDVAIIEVGLGGRLDSTNIIQPDVSVITNISFDHTALLGNTLDKIAFEKAGIMKKSVPVVIGKAEGKVKEVFQKHSQEVQAPIFWAWEEFPTKLGKDQYNNTLINCEGGAHLYNDIPCALNGLYQMENAATTLTLVECLRAKKYNIKDDDVYKGFSNVLSNTGLRGRWETLSLLPHVICDTGHNVAGMLFVTEQLRHTHHQNLHFILGMVSDKDISGVLAVLPKDAIFYFTKASIPRALNEKDLEQLGAKFGLKGNSYPTVSEALAAAKKECRPNDLIFVGGSNFVVAEVL
ncbi:MAG TPA: folylpolyglutamate synthase/dihydrofolate synthase family protein [Bacteroidales bacterium]|nr:folylpolyglutamate synthase/dihydrofolate synthase family protein [Bacteroidales bacterium]